MIKFTDEFMSRIEGSIPDEYIHIVMGELSDMLTRYNVEPVCTDIELYEGYLPECFKAFFVTKKIEGKSRVTSVLSILKEMNRTMNEDNPEYYCVPDEDEMVSQLLFMYEISGGKDLYDWVDDMYQTTHITVETFVDDTVRYVKDFENSLIEL